MNNFETSIVEPSTLEVSHPDSLISLQVNLEPQTPQADSFFISLDLFDGPLDLLLHLVKLQELPVDKISLGLVAEQFFQCISNNSNLEVEIAGEYLVIASTLLSIKARYILNDPEEIFNTDENAALEEDPHEVLLRRLKELEIFKDACSDLASVAFLGVDVFAIDPSYIAPLGADPRAVNDLADHNPFILGKALRSMIKRRQAIVPPLTFAVDPVSVSQRMEQILGCLITHKSETGNCTVEFQELILKACNVKKLSDLTAGMIISCFLALLELCKRQVIQAIQDIHFKELSIELLIDTLDSVPSEIMVADYNG